MEADLQYMRLAIERAREGEREGNAPFGACLIDEHGNVLACEHNSVNSSMDPTAHAVLAAVRSACRRINSTDLSRCTLYTTVEPCPMCFTAAHVAHIGRIVYGVTLQEAMNAGLATIPIGNLELKRRSGSAVSITEGLGREECLALVRLLH